MFLQSLLNKPQCKSTGYQPQAARVTYDDGNKGNYEARKACNTETAAKQKRHEGNQADKPRSHPIASAKKTDW